MWIQDETTQAINVTDDKKCRMPSGSAMKAFGGARPKQTQATNMQCKMENIPLTRPAQFPAMRKPTAATSSSSTSISMPEPKECARCGANTSFEHLRSCETCREAICNSCWSRMTTLGFINTSEPRLVCSMCSQLELNSFSSK